MRTTRLEIAGIIAVATVVVMFAAAAVYAGIVETVTHFPGTNVKVIKIDWTADATANIVQTNMTNQINGKILKVVADPGSPAPTANYDIYINSQTTGDDVLAGGGMNLHTTSTEMFIPAAPVHYNGSLYTGLAYSAPLHSHGPIAFSFTGNAVASADGDFFIYVEESR